MQEIQFLTFCQSIVLSTVDSGLYNKKYGFLQVYIYLYCGCTGCSRHRCKYVFAYICITSRKNTLSVKLPIHRIDICIVSSMITIEQQIVYSFPEHLQADILSLKEGGWFIVWHHIQSVSSLALTTIHNRLLTQSTQTLRGSQLLSNSKTYFLVKSVRF